jgi:hypothetical protein
MTEDIVLSPLNSNSSQDSNSPNKLRLIAMEADEETETKTLARNDSKWSNVVIQSKRSESGKRRTINPNQNTSIYEDGYFEKSKL